MYEDLIMNAKSATGIVKISDPNTGEVFVHQENAIHFGNLAFAVTTALQGSDLGHITFMAFGSGGTSIDSSGNISYRSPNTSNLQDASAEPYQATYFEGLSDTGTSISTIAGTSNCSDLVSTVLIAFREPNAASQESPQTAHVT